MVRCCWCCCCFCRVAFVESLPASKRSLQFIFISKGASSKSTKNETSCRRQRHRASSIPWLHWSVNRDLHSSREKKGNQSFPSRERRRLSWHPVVFFSHRQKVVPLVKVKRRHNDESLIRDGIISRRHALLPIRPDRDTELRSDAVLPVFFLLSDSWSLAFNYRKCTLLCPRATILNVTVLTFPKKQSHPRNTEQMSQSACSVSLWRSWREEEMRVPTSAFLSDCTQTYLHISKR
jgi:hypothetical protein